MPRVRKASIAVGRRGGLGQALQLPAGCVEIPLMKVLLSLAVYLSLIGVLGYVLASLVARDRLSEERGDDEF
jgi:hypothetical protein